MIAHLVACTIVAAVAVVAALVLPGQRAAWRHAILFAALLRFAIPTGWITQVGRRVVPVRIEPVERLLRRPWESAPEMGDLTRRPGGPGYGAWWILGVAVSLAISARRAWRRIPAVRAASDIEATVFGRVADGVAAKLRIVDRDLVPGAWGMWRAIVLLPDGLSAELSEAELEAVLAHEVAHVCRYDNLIAALARVIVSVFWFHPLVWWMERRMLAERETACDEMVLARGTAQRDYMAGILKVCRLSFAVASGYAGVNGSNLERRMEHIMTVDLRGNGSRAARALLALAMSLAALVPMAGGYLRAQDRIQPAQTPAMTEVERLMKENRSDDALRLLQSEVDKNPQRLDLEMALGNTEVRSGKYDQALATFEGILTRVAPESNAAGDLFVRIGETQRRKGDKEAAVDALSHAERIMPNNVVVVSTLALVLDAAGRPREAEAVYRRAIQLDERNGVALNNLAYLLSSSQRDLDEALSMALQAHEVLPNLTEIDDTLGWIYLKRNEAQKAIETFEQLVADEPGRSTFHYHLAMAYAQKGTKGAALDQLKAALECNPPQEELAKIKQLASTMQ